MKTITTGVFSSRDQAETAINQLHSNLGIPLENISFLYKNIEGEHVEGSGDEIDIATADEQTVGEATVTGAVVGGSIGALAGVATVAGLIPVVGPIFAAGPLLAAIGIGAGAVGTAATATATGAMAGGLIGALAQWGVPEDKAREYESKISSGDILLTAEADHKVDVTEVFRSNGANAVESYSV